MGGNLALQHVVLIGITCVQSQKTQRFRVADFATLSDERMSRSKIFLLFNMGKRTLRSKISRACTFENSWDFTNYVLQREPQTSQDALSIEIFCQLINYSWSCHSLSNKIVIYLQMAKLNITVMVTNLKEAVSLKCMHLRVKM